MRRYGRWAVVPLTATLMALVLRAVTLYVIAVIVGQDKLRHGFAEISPGWIALIAVAEVATYPAYVFTYRSVARLDEQLRLNRSTTVRLVLAGFGPETVSGGFGMDRSMLRTVTGDPDRARRHVGAVSAMEWAVLAPLTTAAAVALLVERASVSATVTWPWALGLPAGVVAAVWASSPRRVSRLSTFRGQSIRPLARLLEEIVAVRTMVTHPRPFAGAWVGMTLYWVAEIAALYGALRTAGLTLGIPVVVVAYSGGYLASRRALPLGGAGLAEIFLVYSLYGLNVPLNRALIAVMAYRVFNFMLVVIPALLAYRGLKATLDGGETPLRSPGARPVDGDLT